MAKLYPAYILASRSRVLYTRMTNNLTPRVCERREGKVPGFTWHYRIHRLVYCQPFSDVRAAIVREKQMKAWTRANRNGLLRRQEKQIPRFARDNN
jgi:putative endonuclease